MALCFQTQQCKEKLHLIQWLKCPSCFSCVYGFPFQSWPYLPRPIWAYLKTEGGGEGGHICPPYVFWIWLGSGFQLFLGRTCLGVIYHIQGDSWSLDDENPPQKWLTFIIFHWSERLLTQFVRIPPYEILVFLPSFIFSAKRDNFME